MVVDGHVDVGSLDTALAAAVPEDEVANTADPPQAPEVEVDEVPRLGVLVAHDQTRRLQRPEPTQPQPPALGDHRGDGECVVLGDPATAPALAVAHQDVQAPKVRQAVRRRMRLRGAILQRRPGVSGHGLHIRRPDPADPLVDRLARNAMPRATSATGVRAWKRANAVARTKGGAVPTCGHSWGL